MGLKKNWNHVKRFNNATFLRLSEARSCISIIICVGLFVFDDFSGQAQKCGVVKPFHMIPIFFQSHV
jgi:hypothetical protein